MLTTMWTSVALGLHGVVRPPRVVVRVAEAGFVDHENLERGETCSLALKAFDASDHFLCAGALVRRRSSSLGYEVHDCWIADSIESGVGPNLQTRGAQLILDALFLHHLEARTRGNDVGQFSVFAGDGTGCYAASHVAARSRGFVRESTCADSDERTLTFCEETGCQRYEEEIAALGTAVEIAALGTAVETAVETAPETAPATAPGAAAAEDGAAAAEDGAAAAARVQQLRVVRGILQHLRVQTPDTTLEGGSTRRSRWLNTTLEGGSRGRARRSARHGVRGPTMSSSLLTNLPRDDDDSSLPPPDDDYSLPIAPTRTTSISGTHGSSVAITSISGSRGSRGFSDVLPHGFISGFSDVLADLRSDEWQPLRTSSRWRNPCFISSFFTVSSVASACHHGAVHFGVGPLLVLLSSILYWQNPVREIAFTLIVSLWPLMATDGH